jgi:cholestenol delta-isomerase
MIVSIGQLYGVILYYATSMFDHYYKGVYYSRPEALYFWIYYFGMNFFWAVIPTRTCRDNQLEAQMLTWS